MKACQQCKEHKPTFLTLYRIARSIAMTSLFLFVGCLPSQLPGQRTLSGFDFAEGNRLYENEAYGEAIQVYLGLIDAGIQDGVVYYNLGNAYYKQGDLGRAILSYRRAQYLLPRDADIAANLKLVRAQTTDQLQVADAGIANLLNYILTGWLSRNEAAIAALVVWVLLCCCAAVATVAQRHPGLYRWMMGILICLLLLFATSLGYAIVDVRRMHAVAITPAIQVRSGPGMEYLVEFNLHAGAEVRVIEQRENWMRIVLPGNLQGWVPCETIELVYEIS
ncbi:MAG: tetratricopeptide repeat protein [Anaerolineae bacterium]|nr:tetratricopeptide repeat protein [Anaerolineae bacterium]